MNEIAGSHATHCLPRLLAVGILEFVDGFQPRSWTCQLLANTVVRRSVC